MLLFLLGAGTVIVLELVAIGACGVVAFLRGVRLESRRQAMTLALLAQQDQAMRSLYSVDKRNLN